MYKNIDLWAIAFLMLVMAIATQVRHFGADFRAGRHMEFGGRSGRTVILSPDLPPVPPLPMTRD